jgi:hypothetical protein
MGPLYDRVLLLPLPAYLPPNAAILATLLSTINARTKSFILLTSCCCSVSLRIQAPRPQRTSIQSSYCMAAMDESLAQKNLSVSVPVEQGYSA